MNAPVVRPSRGTANCSIYGASEMEMEVAVRSILLKAVEEDLWRVVKLFLAVAGLGIVFIILLIIT